MADKLSNTNGKWFWAVPLLLASLCFWQGFSGEGQAVTPPVAQPQQPALKTIPIRELQTGMRVIGDNPELADQQIDPLQITDPSGWRNVRLEMSKADGSLLKIMLLRPVEWLDFHEATIGQIIELDLPELGAAGPAQVLAIEPCPDIEPGNRPLITGTFEHTAANVIDLEIESEAAPIGTTDNHPFWSEDRQEFVEAGELKIGETLSLADGRTTRVTSIIPRAGPETVYNLEVSGEHVYHVGDSGVLVHNTYSSPKVNAGDLPDYLSTAGRYGTKTTKSGNTLKLTSEDWGHIVTGHVKSQVSAASRSSKSVTTVFTGTSDEYLNLLQDATKQNGVVKEINKALKAGSPSVKIDLKVGGQAMKLHVDLNEFAIKSFHPRGAITNPGLFEPWIP